MANQPAENLSELKFAFLHDLTPSDRKQFERHIEQMMKNDGAMIAKFGGRYGEALVTKELAEWHLQLADSQRRSVAN